MARILIAWELGANYGHLMRQMLVTRELRRRGHDVLFACRDLAAAAAIAGREGFACVQAPNVRVEKRHLRDPQCYADILAACGFGEVATIEAAACGWFGLIDLYGPHAMLSDHAPLAQFAARLRGLPVMQIGMGFELPPATHPLPILKPWRQIAECEVFEREARIVASMNQLCERRGARPMKRLSDLYATEAPVLATFPELDHFPRGAEVKYVGPLFSEEDGLDVAWHTKPGASGQRRVFVYLRADPSLAAVLQVLSRTNAEVVTVLPDSAPEMIQRFKSERLRIYRHPVRLSIVRSADVVVSNGGHGLTAAALLAGAALCLLPRSLEQWLLARRVVKMGAGVSLDPDRVEGGVGKVLAELVVGEACREAAKRFAGKYGDFDQRLVVERIVAALESLSMGQQPKPIDESAFGSSHEHPGGYKSIDDEEHTGRVKC